MGGNGNKFYRNSTGMGICLTIINFVHGDEKDWEYTESENHFHTSLVDIIESTAPTDVYLHKSI